MLLSRLNAAASANANGPDLGCGLGDSDMDEAPSANRVHCTARSQVKSAIGTPGSTAGRSKDEQRSIAAVVTDDSDIDDWKYHAGTKKYRRTAARGARSTTVRRSSDGDDREDGKNDRDDHVKVVETPYYDRDSLYGHDVIRGQCNDGNGTMGLKGERTQGLHGRRAQATEGDGARD
jgi:hypothetical protein